MLSVENLISRPERAEAALHRVGLAGLGVQLKELGAVLDGAAVGAVVGHREAFFVLNVLLEVEHPSLAVQASGHALWKGQLLVLQLVL